MRLIPLYERGGLHMRRPHEHEHLMIYYYDVLLIDDESLLSVRHSERFRRLARLINTRQGHAELVNRLVIDFSHSSAASMLRKEFAACIKRGGEGLVLKPDDRYFDFSESRKDFSCVNIKMKKEYIGQFGDVGDFAAVGAHYDAKSAKAYRMSNVRWTHFFVGCLDNPAEARAGQEKPSFTVTNIVELSEVQLKSLLTFAHVDAVDPEHNDAINIRLEPGISRGMKLSTVFRNPPVFDLRCFSFDMESNSRFWSLRFPTVSKVHFDRTYLDAISFAELQDMAEKAKAEPLPDGSQELAEWIRALEKADPRGVAVDATSQQSKITAATPPPPRSGSYNQTTPSCLSDAAPSTINRSNNALPTLTPPTSSDFEPQLPGSENAVVAHGRQKGQVLGKRSRVEEASPRQGGPPSPVKRSRTELSSSVEKCTCHCHSRKRTRSI